MSFLVADEAVDTSDVNSVLTILLLLAETCPTQASQVIGHGDQHLPVLVYNNKVNMFCKNIFSFTFICLCTFLIMIDT